MLLLINKLLNIGILNINTLLFLFFIIIIHLLNRSEDEKQKCIEIVDEVKNKNTLQQMKILELDDLVSVLMKKSQEDEKKILNYIATDLSHKEKFDAIKVILYSNKTSKIKVSLVKDVLDDEEISDE